MPQHNVNYSPIRMGNGLRPGRRGHELGIYAITGGAGFIGSHLADALLSAGYSVRVVDNFSTGKIENVDPRCEIVRGDVCDQAVVRRALLGVSGCFHLAAVASVARANEDWIGTHNTNLGGFINVLDASRHLGGLPVVYASSAAVYGKLSGMATETALAVPQTAYGADKLGCELHARAGTLVHGVPSLGLRFFNVYGPRQDPLSPYSGVISIFAHAIGAGRPIHIHGTGLQSRDFVYVGDIVKFLIEGMTALQDGRCTDEWAGLAVNACTGRETSVVQLAQLIGDLLACDPVTTTGPARAGDIDRSVGSPALAKSLLNVIAGTSLRDGLVTTLASLRDEKRLQRA